MLFETGEKVHVVVRRRFEDDVRRHFVGEVKAVSESVARVEGYTFIFDTTRNEYQKRQELRIKLVALNDSGNVITVIPAEIQLETLRYEQSANRRLVLTDGNQFSLDINEFGANR